MAGGANVDRRGESGRMHLRLTQRGGGQINRWKNKGGHHHHHHHRQKQQLQQKEQHHHELSIDRKKPTKKRSKDLNELLLLRSKGRSKGTIETNEANERNDRNQ